MSNGKIYLCELATVVSRVVLIGTGITLWVVVGFGDALPKLDQRALANSAGWGIALSMFAIAWLTAKPKIIPAAPDKEAR